MKTKLTRQLSVGEVARRSDVSVSALHFYEAEGLIKSERTRSGHRRFSRDVLRRIAVIRVGQAAGLTLKDIADALSGLPDQRTPTVKDWEQLSASWRDLLNGRIDQLTRLRDRLTGCIGCGCLSLDQCPLRNEGDRLAVTGSGARLLLETTAPDA